MFVIKYNFVVGQKLLNDSFSDFSENGLFIIACSSMRREASELKLFNEVKLDKRNLPK